MKKLITFEQVTPHLHKWARHFCNKHFDYWELINSVWVYGKVRFLPQSKIKYVSARVKYDMIDYMRRVSGYRRKSFFHNESDLSSVENDNDFWNTLRVEDDNNIEQKDFVGFLICHSSLSRKEKLIMKLIYQENYTQEEVGRV